MSTPTLHEQLWSLHLIELNLRGLRSRLDSASRRYNAQNTRLSQIEQQAQELEAQLKLSKVKVHELETDSKGAEQRIDTLRERMNNVTSNKEYSALLVEVNTLKADRAKVDDQSLEHMQKAEELEARLNEMKQKSDEQTKLTKGSSSDVDKAREEIADRLAELEQEREEAAKPLPAEVLRLYTKLADDFDGEALAEVEEQDRKRMEYSCGACYQRMPIERVNAVLTKPDQLTTCASCDRILIAKSKLREELASSGK